MRLGEIIKLYMAVEGYAIRDVAADIGVSPATLCRIINGKPCDIRSLTKLLAWLTDEGEEAV